MDIVGQVPGLFLGCNGYNFYTVMDMASLFFRVVDPIQLEASHEESEALVRKDCNSFLKTKQGFRYLLTKYPKLSISEAVNEYIKKALWIDSIV